MFIRTSNLHYCTVVGGDTLTKVEEWREMVATINVLLVTCDMHTLGEISLKFFTGKQMPRKHPDLEKNVMLAQNEVNKVAAEFLIVRLLWKLNVNLLLTFVIKYSNMVPVSVLTCLIILCFVQNMSTMECFVLNKMVITEKLLSIATSEQ